MNSIRSYLAVRLFMGFVFLLSIASTLVYFISERILESDFDSRLFAKAQAVVASTSQIGTKIDIDWTNLPQEFHAARGKRSDLIEILDSSGRPLWGDAFLSGGAVPFADHAEYQNAKSIKGEKLRVLALPFLAAVEEDDAAITPPGIRQKCQLLVASARAPLDRSLGLMAGVLCAMTILTSILSLAIVVLVLGRGLRPLATLSRKVAQIDEASLGNRIQLDSFPVEVLPVVEKLNDLLRRLEVSFARERRFSADVAHELRTPVAELRSLSEIMLRQSNLPADTRQAFQDVLDASCQMQALVTTLLEMVRAEADMVTRDFRKVDLGNLLHTCWKSYVNRAETKGIKWTFHISDHFWMETDQYLLRLVLHNLLSNAVEYTPVGGTIEVSFKDSSGGVILGIQNSTHDISPRDLPHFFERFWRKDKVRGNSDHVGLGLSLTEMLCKRLKIPLTVSMPTPTSVCFWLAIPASQLPQ